MLSLSASGLFGGGLILIKIPRLVNRYNECLIGLGIEPTMLKEFNIDCMGWSPEIAEEKNDYFYLSHGVANQLAIILTPDQFGKPVHFPSTSFDRRMMNQYFERFKGAIADITVNTCIWLDIDQEITDYKDPSDLLLMEYIIIRSHANGLIKAAKYQTGLVEQFNEHEDSWFDRGLHSKLAASAREFGDLRFRQVDIPAMKFDDFRFFYTRAFGGVFVFRDLDDDQHSLLVLENESEARKIRKLSSKHIAMTSGPVNKLIDKLTKEGLINIDLEWYRSNIDALRHKRGGIVLDTLCHKYPDIDYINMTSAKRKKLILEMGNRMPKVFFDLEKLIKTLSNGDDLPEVSRMPMRLRAVLVHPSDQLSKIERQVVWRLICRIFSLDILKLYIFDRNLFYQHYMTWPESKKAFAIDFIKQEYNPNNHFHG